MMEIGSILETDVDILFKEPLNGNITFPFMAGSPYSLELFNTGRSAIEALLRHLGSPRVHMPSFNCTSVADAAERAGCTVSLYPVEADLSVRLDMPVGKGDVLYLVQYFGRAYSEEVIRYAKECGATVVEDVSMCLLSDPSDRIGFGDYIIGSIRKWLPVPDGGFIASKKELPQFSKEDAANGYSFNYLVAQVMKSRYIGNRSLDKQRFLEYSDRGMEALFSDYTIREMSAFSHEILLRTDIASAALRRKENYDYLCTLLKETPMVAPVSGREHGLLPIGMAVTAEERDGLFRHLVDRGIYCNIHWRPNAYSKEFAGSRWLSEHCLTIPCDQRYGKAEMEYISDTVAGYNKR